jgi:bifunctional UDP-N-acetylglucosamine pyrophosphorylase/glucosamine-1-phosphate N-acetyltransferase
MVDPTGYGRILRRGGRVIGIREELDASAQEKNIHEVNTGVYLFHPKALFSALKKIQPTNQKKEYYLTDTIRLIDEAGGEVQALPQAGPEESQGINSRADLAKALKMMNQKNIQRLQMEGVTIVSPEQTFIAPGVRIGKETVIYPWTYIEKGVRIGRKCQIGPFAKIRTGSLIEDEAVIGSFVEINRSKIGKGVLAKHLAYLGDAEVGAGTNIGAGTITANYDGRKKNKTRIGKKSFIGVDTVFIAPVTLGDEASTGAGAVLTRGTKVAKGEVVVGVPARSLRRRKGDKHVRGNHSGKG